MTIDAHIHLWRLARGDNIALTPAMAPIYRDREPAALRPQLEAAGIDRIIVVQAAETLAETLFIIGLARKFSWISGIVAWIDPASPAIEEEVAALAWNPHHQGRATGARRQPKRRLDARPEAGARLAGARRT